MMINFHSAPPGIDALGCKTNVAHEAQKLAGRLWGIS